MPEQLASKDAGVHCDVLRSPGMLWEALECTGEWEQLVV